MSHECRNFKTLLEYELSVIGNIPHCERMEYIEREGQRLRDTFCNAHCPIGKYLRRYEHYQRIKLDRIRRAGL